MKRQSAKTRERIVRLNIALRKQPRHNLTRCNGQNCAQSGIRTIRLVTPVVFNLADKTSRGMLVTLVNRMHKTLEDGHRVKLDFKETQRLNPCGTLFFAANLDKALDQHPGEITCNYPEDDIVEQLFQHIGLLQRMGLSSRRSITAENVRHWHFVKGDIVDASGFADLMEQYQNTFAGEIRMGLHSGLSEAVTNTCQHAYPDIANTEGGQRRWWMFAQRKEDELTVAICDLGIGIAESLKRNPEWRDVWLKWRGKSKDQKLIEAATGQRTSTKQPHRGKGLPEMLDFVKTSQIGGMIIHSNHGAYGYDVSSRRKLTRTLDPPMPGTFIQWTLSMSAPAKTT